MYEITSKITSKIFIESTLRDILAPFTAFYLCRHSLSKTVQTRMKVAFPL